VAGRQLELFGTGAPRIDERFAAVRRIPLGDGAWLDLQLGWLGGDGALFDRLERELPWAQERRYMYERMVDTPRLYAELPERAAGQPLIARMAELLSRRYREDLCRITVALYRDGRDSVAFHGDTTARDLPEATVATVSLGCRRRFLLRPATGGGRSRALELGGGDLLVMGGSCQRTFRHAIPKVAAAGPRIAIMFRPLWTPPG
jgi:alkylated DNA repair dioxygenase AlkB